MRTSFLRTHLDILDSSAYVEVHLNISPSAVHIHPHVLIKNIVRSLKVRTCTNVTPVTHLQTQTSKFEIYSADNWLFRHCQSKGRLKHLPAHISCSRICNFSAFGHKTWNAICPTTCLEMDLFQFSCEICGDVFFRICKPMPNNLPRWFSPEDYCQQ